MKDRFPLGARVSIERLTADPVSVYNELREQEPITWIEDLGMYFVTGHKDVVAVLQNSETFIAGTEKSTIFDTFGLNMLTAEGDAHQRYKSKTRRPFGARQIRDHLESQIECHVDDLIDGFAEDGRVEFRAAFAQRLPILTILSFFGIELAEETQFRDWYDAFEAALANLTWDQEVRTIAQHNSENLLARFQESVEQHRQTPREGTFISYLVRPQENPLSDEEIVRNLAMIAFGGISTVEALLLNSLWCLSKYPETLQRVQEDYTLLPRTLEEVIRFVGPVQSAHRYVARDNNLLGVDLHQDDVVNCLLVAANHDPRIFHDPHVFDIDRDDIRRHLGFAVGPHHCLGAHLARAEARIALERIFARLPNCRMDPLNPSVPVGYEFRQPLSLHLVWD